MNWLLFGPPGAGKGTQSELLVRRLNLKHISTGDLLRSAVANQTVLGSTAQGFMSRGELVPDQVVIDLVKEALGGFGDRDHWVLDGFPRTIEQAQALDQLLEEVQMPIGRAVFIDVKREELITRLSGRRVCGSCGFVCHIVNKPPRVAGICDACGSELVQRADDQPAAIAKRLDVYEQSVSALKLYYGEQGLARTVDGVGDVEDIFSRIVT